MMRAVFSRFRSLQCTALIGLLLGSAATAAAQEPTAPPPTAAQPSGVLVEAIEVRGNERIEGPVIQVTSGIQPGQTIRAPDYQNAVRRLMATGELEDVRLYAEGDPQTAIRLIIEVEERPLIARVDFTGLERISAATLRDTLQITSNQPLDPNQVLLTEQMIRDLLAKEGVQVESVDTVLTPMPGGQGYRLTYEVQEGHRLAIADIDFTGNEAFSDDALRDAMRTGQEGFLWFRSGRYDREVLQEDLRSNLPAFYGRHGYIDFNVLSDTLIVDPESGKARLVVGLEEGPQYRLGEFVVEGSSRFPTEELRTLFTAAPRSVLGLPFGRDERESGMVFDREAVEEATTSVRQMYSNEGYLYVQVEPIIERIPVSEVEGDQPVVNVTLAIREGSPFYVNRVRITGNTKTHESVIRDRLMIFPGDVYNEERVIRSFEAISGLGFFETPLPMPDIVPDPETSTVDITFHVEETNTGNASFGTSFGGGGFGRAGGLSGFVGYSDVNLFGQAKQAEVRAEYGFGRTSLLASYTDPYLLGTRNSGSVSLFHTDDRFRGFSFTDGRYVRTGGSLRFGIPVPGLRFTRANVGYSLARYDYHAIDEESCENNIFCQPDAIASNISVGVTRNTKNHPMFPSTGTRQNMTVEQYGGPLGGDGDFQKLTAEAEWWAPIARLGGNQPGSRPIILALGLQARGGSVFGDAGRFPLQRFFLGGTQFGERLRGYSETTITPDGFFDRGFRGVPSEQRLGDAFVSFTAEAAARINNNLSISMFSDAGNIWNDPSEINPTRMFRSVGLGVQLVTPFGPFGLAYAYGFDQPEPEWQFHFTINQGN